MARITSWLLIGLMLNCPYAGCSRTENKIEDTKSNSSVKADAMPRLVGRSERDVLSELGDPLDIRRHDTLDPDFFSEEELQSTIKMIYQYKDYDVEINFKDEVIAVRKK